MDSHSLEPEDLVRQAVIEVAQLPENELLVVIEMIDALKKQRRSGHRQQAAKMVAMARVRAEETKQLSREEMMEQFIHTMDAIREEAIDKGIAIEGEAEDE